jgi:hypothetical protein
MSFPKWLRLDSPVAKTALSIGLVFHFVTLGLAFISQRGSSQLIDTYLSRVAVYTAIGNWKPDTTPLTIATPALLTERLVVEKHFRNGPEESWHELDVLSSSSDRPSTMLVHRWLRQLNGLLFYENTEGVTRMLAQAVQAESSKAADKEQKSPPELDLIRVRVTARPSQANYASSALSSSEIVYVASVVRLGESGFSLLPKLEDRRASKALSAPDGQDGAK